MSYILIHRTTPILIITNELDLKIVLVRRYFEWKNCEVDIDRGFFLYSFNVIKKKKKRKRNECDKFCFGLWRFWRVAVRRVYSFSLIWLIKIKMRTKVISFFATWSLGGFFQLAFEDNYFNYYSDDGFNKSTTTNLFKFGLFISGRVWMKTKILSFFFNSVIY